MSKILLFQTVSFSVANRIVLINFYLDFIFYSLLYFIEDFEILVQSYFLHVIHFKLQVKIQELEKVIKNVLASMCLYLIFFF